MAAPDDDDRRQAYLAEVIDSAAILHSLDDVAAVEAFASGAVAEWLALGGDSLSDALGPDAGIVGRAVEWIEQGHRARPQAGDPPWMIDLGTSRLVVATRLVDPDEPSEFAYVLEFETDSGARHDLAVTVLDGRLVDVAAGSSGLVEAVGDDAASTFVVEPIPTAAARDALGASISDVDPNELSARARLDLPLLCRRFAVDPHSVSWGSAADESVVELERDADDDRYAAELLESALRPGRSDSSPPPEPVLEAADRFARLVAEAGPDATALMTVAGRPDRSDALDLLVHAAGAYLAPADLSPHDADEQGPIAALEPADWVGVILGLLRGVEPPPLDGAACVRLINRCPEITTSIPKRDAPTVAWAFDRVLYGWERTGVLDADGAVTEAGRWLLPQAAARAWRAD